MEKWLSIFPLLHNFQATSGSEYGEVLCWASNNLGEQRTPCVFHVMPLGTPQPPTECEVGRIGTCREGHIL